jgi:hypothetical protein
VRGGVCIHTCMQADVGTFPMLTFAMVVFFSKLYFLDFFALVTLKGKVRCKQSII